MEAQARGSYPVATDHSNSAMEVQASDSLSSSRQQIIATVLSKRRLVVAIKQQQQIIATVLWKHRLEAAIQQQQIIATVLWKHRLVAAIQQQQQQQQQASSRS